MTLRRLFAAIALLAFSFAAIVSLVPTDEQTLVQIMRPQSYFGLATIGFALTPILISRCEYATSRSFSVILIANLLIVFTLVVGWHFVNEQIPSPTIKQIVLYPAFLIGLIAFRKYTFKSDSMLRHRTELAIPAVLASFCFQCWLFPLLKYSRYSGSWWLPGVVIAMFVTTTIAYVVVLWRFTRPAT